MKTPAEHPITAALARMPSRQLHMVLAGVLAIAAALAWTFVVRAPLAQVRLQQAERARMAQAAGDPVLRSQLLSAAAARVALLETAVAGEGAASLDQAQLQLRLIGLADRASARHGVLLRGAVPGPARAVAGFQEVSVDIDAAGDYRALLAWMAEIDGPSPSNGAAQPRAAIVAFDLGAGENAGARSVKLRLAAYLLPKDSK